MKLSDKKRKEAEYAFNEKAKHINREDLKDALYGGARKIEGLVDNIPHSLERLWEDIKLMQSMVKSYYSGEYRDVPVKTISSVAAALIYFVSPVDAILDVIPGLGYLDDAGVVAMCLKTIETDLLAYKLWKEKRSNLEE